MRVMKYVKILIIPIILIAVVMVFSGCKPVDKDNTSTKAESGSEVPEAGNTEDSEPPAEEEEDSSSTVAEKEPGEEPPAGEEEDSSSTVAEEESGEELPEEETSEDITSEGQTTGEDSMDTSDEENGEGPDGDTGDQYGYDNLQEQIDALIEDIKAGNVIPDDHE